MKNALFFILLITLYSFKPQAHQKISESKISAALAFCQKDNMDTSLVIMIDMSIHSGKNRLFVYDFEKEAVIIEGLCAHGVGRGSTATKPVFSNEVGSNCTSLGKFSVKGRSYSNWGINIHYKMYGLEKTNSNAFKRIVVLHSYTPVPNKEIYPQTLFGQSAGCPVLSDATMKKIDDLLKTKKKPVLLWIYT
ncbi:murein L,D-transpeptidase catalytic domain-containing protein [Pedobacter endophyticus]|uniref:Murein L,D-transpeptidase catalytic domain family protein n=1 Tax=Pedobacter endophyticus TaxID=2789740 RepID=A0A7S9Q146_9SPHI|nr:murein L,D-transpeptidase catalytic domain family protein [Pedobacter endophyticus]QPH41392.1 murein L,D-transpeptidase catalytic domain family protein [Pedobacter endophyticus]